ncbi:MFS transporter [Streptomyces sp. UNOC14_S4]|uniref:MFS transporter n=1 Tax=Streptomyces sp. UNOC14_S4 TaxID=2872340 RepID=UPI001E2F43F7|nr:MFS transporter [Streptomyces sp. UNOC14_S4]MCC3768880.1 MFS transporter [Streptomyces sp. UNOC14_S4]
MRLSKAFWLLWSGQTANRFGVLVPAFLVIYLEQNEISTKATTPVVLALFGAGVVVAGLVGGVVADRFGARRVIMTAQLGVVAIASALAFVDNIYVIGACSPVAGLLTAVDRPAAAGLVTALVPKDHFTKAYSILHVGFNIGASLGPVLSGFALAAWPPALFLLWAGAGVLYFVLVAALPKDRLAQRSEGTAEPWSPRRAVGDMLAPFRNPVLLAFLGLSFVLACVYLQFEAALPLHMDHEGISPSTIGLVFAVNAVLMVAALPFVPKVTERMRENTPLVIGAVLVAIGFGLNAPAHNVPWFVGALVVWTLGEVIYVPMASTFLARRSPEGAAGTYQGSFFFAWNLGLILGGPLGIVIARQFGYPALWTVLAAVGIAVAIGFKAMARIPHYADVPGAAELTPAPAAPAAPASEADV